ncbi:hypothetical protein M408DRAFT_326644 [Serendipita vermifera MAFF 305830]|uniref:Transmembrane protein n=1 Tax=Serendipita vermifera MAFF 305830 TaxID=933852 RepID=A0A0C2XVP1_SERVB|nr:hypothetical protein M408DRAFT_326644 [Serendipita vermifera MAFF 305830]
MSSAFSFPAFETPQLQQPSPVAARDSERSPAVSFIKAPRPSTYSPIDLRRLSLSSAASSLPPPYPRQLDDEEAAVPAYGDQQEVQTMARYLFFYGFLFPPFWILGSLILVTPLTPDPSWHAEKDQKTIENILSVMRVVERRWAWRCVIALSTLILLVLIIVGSVLLAQHFGAAH